MRSALPKVLHPICGRPMLSYILDVAGALDAAAISVVLAPATIATFAAQLPPDPRRSYTAQHERRGTGHAALQARSAIETHGAEVLVMLGDTPLLQAESTRRIVEARRAAGALVGILSFHTATPTGYGRIVRDTVGRVLGIVEERAATAEQRAIGECNSGVLCFEAGWMWPALADLPPNPASGEYYLTDLVERAISERGPGAVVAVAVTDEREAWGVNDRAQLAAASAVVQARILEQHMRAGVTIVNPATTTIDYSVTIGPDTIIQPGCVLRGATQIGCGCDIGPHTTLIDARVGDQARLRYAVVEAANLPAAADIGPFAHVAGAELPY